MDPKITRNHDIVGSFERLWAIIIHYPESPKQFLLVMTYFLLRDYNIQPKMELLWSLWVLLWSWYPQRIPSSSHAQAASPEDDMSAVTAQLSAQAPLASSSKTKSTWLLRADIY